jgi:serine/threonine protein kinase
MAAAVPQPSAAQPAAPAASGGLLAAMRTASGLGGGGAPGGARAALTDKYMLGEELGRGAFGQVFKGLDTRSGEAVAIKQL